MEDSSDTLVRRVRKELMVSPNEKWCSETQSFIFPWGEATLTLEDMIVLGGFSVLGDSVQIQEEVELKDTEEKLHKARLELNRTKSKKPYLSDWKKKFMNSGNELEHEAFLVYWLSTFVFPFNNTAYEDVIPIAIKLARGSRIALAPAVLAGIYRDLKMMKVNICALSKNENDVHDLNPTIIRSPFHLVQIWVWERFPGLRPQPNELKNGEPRLARWGNLKFLKTIDNVKLALDSSAEVFQWRPYCNNAIRNWDLPKFYPDKEVILPDGPVSDEDFEFARCLRVSELVGLDTVRQYLPHRVSMQFGMDQDIPSHVGRFSEIAGNHYDENISNFELYIPPRRFEAEVSERYFKWWKQFVLGQKEEPRMLTRPQKRSLERSDRLKNDSEGKGKKKHENSILKEGSA
ncbi:serine/threonine-protein phosphatase 7 long form-like protein [Senna tora]|uniref:Serine/threonine-protein phosphatase 7 long form-like protein n=1 Tax=Senna tora TaxID=362788 RepID=A0A835CKV2_9FABA|nr:serine/threonine-protein phosphatase 7 long form-like protein [Senna tora]